jgi:hypothetical protein
MMNASTQSRQQATMTPRTGTRETGQNMRRTTRRNDYPPDTNKTCLQAKGQHPHPDTMTLMNKTRTSRRVNQMHEGVQPMRQKKLTMLDNTHTECTDSGQVLIRRYPIGRAMIPSSGIMSSPGDRRVNNLGTTHPIWTKDSR